MSDTQKVAIKPHVEVRCLKYVHNGMRPTSGYCQGTTTCCPKGADAETLVNNTLEHIQKYGWYVSVDQSVILCPHCRKGYCEPQSTGAIPGLKLQFTNAVS